MAGGFGGFKGIFSLPGCFWQDFDILKATHCHHHGKTLPSGWQNFAKGMATSCHSAEDKPHSGIIFGQALHSAPDLHYLCTDNNNPIMKQKYRLLVLDLDGTLTNSKKEISPRNLDALIRLQQSGVRLVLASGRPTYGIAPLAEQLQMKQHGGFILSYNGGEIIDWCTDEIIYKNLLPDDVVPLLYEAARRDSHAILTYDGPCILTESPDDPYVEKEAFLNKMQIRPTDDFLQAAPLPLPKCLIVGAPDSLIHTETELSLQLQRRISVYRSEPYFLELVPLGIDKAASLAVLLEKLGMTREEMVAMGDGYNDLSMIEFAGMGVAMANAQEPVRKAADYVTLSNDEDGVAEAVEKLF